MPRRGSEVTPPLHLALTARYDRVPMDWDDMFEVFFGTLLAGLVLMLLVPRLAKAGRREGWFFR